MRLPLSLGLTVGTLAVVNFATHRVPPGVDAAIGAAMVGGLALIARAAGLTAEGLGLARRQLPSGLRWGAMGAGIAAAGYGLASLLPVVRDTVATSSIGWSQTLLKALVIIPLVTVIPEEFAFRGVLWGLVRRDAGRYRATAVSSTLFGLWHVQSALGGGSANESVTAAIGDATVLRVVGTVLLTGLAGVLLCELRYRSGSLAAPILVHWAINGLGEIFVAAV